MYEKKKLSALSKKIETKDPNLLKELDTIELRFLQTMVDALLADPEETLEEFQQANLEFLQRGGEEKLFDAQSEAISYLQNRL